MVSSQGSLPLPVATIRHPVWFFKSLGVGPCAPLAQPARHRVLAALIPFPPSPPPRRPPTAPAARQGGTAAWGVPMTGTGTGNGCELLAKVMRSRWRRRESDLRVPRCPPWWRPPPCAWSPSAARPWAGRCEERAGLPLAPFRIVKLRASGPGWRCRDGRAHAPREGDIPAHGLRGSAAEKCPSASQVSSTCRRSRYTVRVALAF